MIRARFRDGLVIVMPGGSEVLEDPTYQPVLEARTRELRRRYELQTDALWCDWGWVG